MLIGVGGLLVLQGLLTVIGAFRKWSAVLALGRLLCIVSLAVSVLYGAYLFITLTRVDAWVHDLPPSKLEVLAKYAGSGTGVTVEGMVDSVCAWLIAAGLLCVLVAMPLHAIHLSSYSYFKQVSGSRVLCTPMMSSWRADACCRPGAARLGACPHSSQGPWRLAVSAFSPIESTSPPPPSRPRPSRQEGHHGYAGLLRQRRRAAQQGGQRRVVHAGLQREQAGCVWR